MAAIGRIVIAPGKPIGTVSVKGAFQTTVSNPNDRPTTQVTSNNITDFTTTNVQNGYTFIYNSVTQKYEASPIALADVTVGNITGGTF